MNVYNVPKNCNLYISRNLKKQKEFWKMKVAYVENLWKKRHSPTYLKKNPPLLKRKAYFQTCPIPSKINHSKEKLEEAISVCSEVCSNADSFMETCADSVIAESIEFDKIQEDACRADEADDAKLFVKCDENDDEKMDTSEVAEIEIQTSDINEGVSQELNISENSEQSGLENKSEEGTSDKLHSSDKAIFYCSANEMSNEEGFILYEAIVDTEKPDSNIHDSSDEIICTRESEDEHIDSVAAFHDITGEDLENEIIVEVKPEVESDTIEIITVGDSGDEVIAISDSDSIDKKAADKNESLESKDDFESKECETRPKREKNIKKSEYTIRSRKHRSPQEYVKKRTKRNTGKSHKEKKQKNSQKQEEFDYATFDYAYFSELSEEDKGSYLAMKNLVVHDDTEGTFKRENFKLVFVQNCDTYVYRYNCLSRAKEVSIFLIYFSVLYL